MTNFTLLKTTPHTKEWHDIRRSGIGGSDAAVAVGLSPWKTPFQLYLEKIGEAADTQESEPMRWGNVLEPAIRQQYATRTGRTVKLFDGVLRSNKHIFMLANLDGLVDEKRLVEIKTARTAAGWGEAGSDEVPENYNLQVQHYMAVTGAEVTDVAVLIGGSDFRIFEIPANREIQQLLIDEEATFWAKVQNKIPPELSNIEDVGLRFRQSQEGTVIAGDETLMLIQELKSLTEKRKALEESEDTLRGNIMAVLGEKDTLTDNAGKVLATWKTAKASERFDAKTFAGAHPELHKQFVKITEGSRRFLLK